MLYPSFFLEKPPLQTSTNSHAIISSVEIDRRHELVRSTYHNPQKEIQKLESWFPYVEDIIQLPSWWLSGIFFWGKNTIVLASSHPLSSLKDGPVLGQFLHGTLWQGIPLLVVGGHSLFVVGRKLGTCRAELGRHGDGE